MTTDSAQRMTISLPPDAARYLEEYQQSHQLASRSEAVLKAIQALRDQQLAEDYAALARENDPERARFLEGNTDGLEASDGSEWL
ncbi:ribbon-helix-helix domain-containing protein [Deinococcus marmoris]|uniref:ribbon-helix-helix domain-containing protein n=1 Tax=Deinococcus marmoris TaxID=249408 RepID=UPI000495B770|nr:ribbon-helix-helix domain-containing protein [Deinococcus marmoris]